MNVVGQNCLPTTDSMWQIAFIGFFFFFFFFFYIASPIPVRLSNKINRANNSGWWIR